MATTERTAKSITWYDLNLQPGNIATLRGAIASGQPITAANINGVISLLNNALGHYHTYDDAYQLATFGNNGDRNNYYENKNTNVPFFSPGDIQQLGNVSIGNTINATDHNNMRSVAEFLRSHYHKIDDRTS